VADSIRFVRGVGGLCFKGECYGAWAVDGPKMYVLANLLWNTDLKIDDILNDYFIHLYGPAAPAMSRFFARAEDTYRQRVEALRGTEAVLDAYAAVVGERKMENADVRYILAEYNMGFRQFRGIDNRTIEAMEAALKEAEQIAATDETLAKRVRFVRVAFNWGRLHWAPYHKLETIRRASVKTDAEANALLETMTSYFGYEERRQVYLEEKLAPFAGYSAYSQDGKTVDKKRVVGRLLWSSLEPLAFESGIREISRYRMESKDETGRQVAAYWAEVAAEHDAMRAAADAE
jgi:hypothetical protein